MTALMDLCAQAKKGAITHEQLLADLTAFPYKRPRRMDNPHRPDYVDWDAEVDHWEPDTFSELRSLGANGFIAMADVQEVARRRDPQARG